MWEEGDSAFFTAHLGTHVWFLGDSSRAGGHPGEEDSDGWREGFGEGGRQVLAQIIPLISLQCIKAISKIAQSRHNITAYVISGNLYGDWQD